MEATVNYEALGFGICFIILFFAWLVYLDSKKPTYEIRFIEGWFVIRYVKNGMHVKRFKTSEEAIEWYNENCI
jgi:hypothetical protein